MTRHELLQYRDILNRKRRELESRMRLDGIAIERAADLVDDGSLAGERDFAIAALDRESATLREIRNALHRIGEGSYGECLRCGLPIRPARLAAIPWAAYCIACQEAVDRANEVNCIGALDDAGEAA